nr:MAG TPA: DNA pilot protein VP2 [Microviridae sp.]
MGKIGEILGAVASPLFGGATSLFAGIRSSKQQQKIIARQIEEQRKENEAQRRYNLMLAEKQNKWNIEQWQRNNDYNTPSAVMSRLRSAGINPHMYYSKGNAMGGVSTSSPEMTSGSPAEAVDTSGMLGQSTYGQSVQMAMDKAVQVASIRKLNADTRLTEQKADTEKYNTDIFESDAAFRNALNSSTLRLTDMDIDLKGSQKHLTDGQVGMLRYEAAMLQKQMDKIDRENELMAEQIANLSEERRSIILKRVLDSELVEAQCKELAARTHLSYEEARDLAATRAARLLNLNASTQKMQNEAYVSAWDTKIKHLELDLNSDMFEWRKTMEKAHDVVDLTATVSQEVNRWTETINGMTPTEQAETVLEQKFDSEGQLRGTKSVEHRKKSGRRYNKFW